MCLSSSLFVIQRGGSRNRVLCLFQLVLYNIVLIFGIFIVSFDNQQVVVNFSNLSYSFGERIVKTYQVFHLGDYSKYLISSMLIKVNYLYHLDHQDSSWWRHNSTYFSLVVKTYYPWSPYCCNRSLPAIITALLFQVQNSSLTNLALIFEFMFQDSLQRNPILLLMFYVY